MYRLTVVAGPNRGSSYPLHEGETTMGRLSVNSIVLNSSKVSKRHCALVVSNGEVVCKDQGSSNGTFVNGILSKTPRQIRSGDRITVGDFVFELSLVQTDIVRDPLALPAGVAAIGGNVIPFPGTNLPAPDAGNGLTGFSKLQNVQQVDVMPQDFKSRMLWIFERRIMPHLYRLLLKYEWRTLLFGSFFAFSLLAIFFAVAPLIQSNEVMMVRELERRARFMAQQIVEINTPYILQKNESKTEITDSIAKGYGVRQALLLDLENRILAPASKLNQYLTTGPAAIAAVKAKQEFENGRVKTFSIPVGSHTVVAVEPMLLYSEREGRNIPVAMAVVALDATVVTQGMGDVFMIFAESFIWLAFFAMLLALAVYRLTLKPLEIIQGEIDRSLKGEVLDGMTRDCRFEELTQLQDVLESLLRRVASGNAEIQKREGTSTISIGDECLPSFRLLGEHLPHGMAFCDGERRALFLNAAFEELTGIRSDNAFMQHLPDQARDQAFAMMLNDLFERSAGAPDGVFEELEFSGVAYQIKMIPIGNLAGVPRGYLVTTIRSGNG
jgi:PAS domain-containing protein